MTINMSTVMCSKCTKNQKKSEKTEICKFFTHAKKNALVEKCLTMSKFCFRNIKLHLIDTTRTVIKLIFFMTDYHNFKKAGIIHKLIQVTCKKNCLPLGGCTPLRDEDLPNTLDIVKFIEENTKRLTHFDAKNPWNAGIAFPVGVSVNKVAAHFTPDAFSSTAIQQDDVVKIDFGVHVNGCISDGAFTWCPSGKYNDLIHISEEATQLGVQQMRPDACLGDIGESIQEFIESHELEYDGHLYNVRSVIDLCGHSIAPFHIHSGKAVPNVKIHYPVRVREGEVYAVETFPTLGDPHLTSTVECNHFMLSSEFTPNKFTSENSIVQQIYSERKTLAFCPRWFPFQIPDSVYIKKYPVLYGSDIIAQTEKTVFIGSTNTEILN